jgi:pyruvate kinase
MSKLEKKFLNEHNIIQEINWFKTNEVNTGIPDNMNIIQAPHPTNYSLKIIWSIGKDYKKEDLNYLINQGLEIFHINSQYFNLKEYSQIVDLINSLFKETGKERLPLIIYDLKGAVPTIMKLNGLEKKQVHKGGVIKLCYDQHRLEGDDIIQIDRKISSSVNINDTIIIENSRAILKVISFDKFFKKFQRRSSLYLCKDDDILKHMKSDTNISYHKERYDKTQLKWYNEEIEEPIDYTPWENSSPSGVRKNICEGQEGTQVNQGTQDTQDFPKYFKKEIFNNPLSTNTNKKIIFPHFKNNFNNSYGKKRHDLLNRRTESLNDLLNRNRKSFCINDNDYCEDYFDQLKKTEVKTSDDKNYHDKEFNLYDEKVNKYRIKPDFFYSPNPCDSRNNMIICEVINEGIISIHSSINLLETDLLSSFQAPFLCAKDIIDLSKVTSIGIFIIFCLVNHHTNIDEIRELVQEDVRQKLKIFARIETKLGIENFESILKKCDGIVISRGLIHSNVYNANSVYNETLGIEAYLIQKCQEENKILILQDKSSDNDLSSFEFAWTKKFDAILIKNRHNFKSLEIMKHSYDSEREDPKFTSKTCVKNNDFVFKEFTSFTRINNDIYQVCKNSKKLNIIYSLFDSVLNTCDELNIHFIIVHTNNFEYLKLISKLNLRNFLFFPSYEKDLTKISFLLKNVIPFHIDQNKFTQENLEEEINKYIIQIIFKRFKTNYKSNTNKLPVDINKYEENNGCNIKIKISENKQIQGKNENLDASLKLVDKIVTGKNFVVVVKAFDNKIDKNGFYVL